MSVLKRAALTVPALKRIFDQRNQLIADTQDLRVKNEALQGRLNSLAIEPRSTEKLTSGVQDALGGPLHGVTAEKLNAIGYALADNRLILTDYPYYPHERPLAKAAAGRHLAARFAREESAYADTLRGIAQHIDRLSRIKRDATEKLAPLWDNPWFPPFDGATLYGLIAETRPGRYIEVGSGISTRFARQAINDLGLPTKIISIDPHPHNSVDGLCDEIIVARMEDMPSSFWEGLSPNDMLFIDNSHRSFPASDVTVFFSEVMPALPPGILYGMHDIFLPNDYPDVWKERFYNEQYLLMTYLLGGGGTDTIVLPVNWSIGRKPLFDILAPLFDQQHLFAGVNIGGGCFWLRRGDAA
jgi:predicted O-methyltransferase YrrM